MTCPAAINVVIDRNEPRDFKEEKQPGAALYGCLDDPGFPNNF
jgi:hypothetical protein